jgi:hypothetical protein
MTAPSHRLRRTLILFAKLGLAAAILGYLFVQVQGQQGFTRLVNEPKQWRLLAAALACTAVAVTLSFVRWHVLIRALELDFRLSDSLRLGALGFALNFVSLGAVGGDFFKAFFLARDMHGRRTEAVATVIADRVLGLLVMLLLASLASLFVEWSGAPTLVRLFVHMIQLVTIAALAGVLLVLLVPALSGEWVQQKVGAVPLVGVTAARLIGAVSAYREQKRYLLVAAGISLVLDVLIILSFYCVARGLPVESPTLAEHFVVVPAATMAGSIPATPSGLGTMEAAVDALYQAMPRVTAVPAGDGTLVALGQRVTMILMAVGCFGFYLLCSGELRKVIHEVEEAEAEAETM